MSDTENIVTLPGEEDIEAEAASWLTMMDREVVSEVDVANFNHWLNKSDRHRVAFNELVDLWDDLAILQELDDIAESAMVMPEARQPWWQRRSFMSMAASLLVGIVVSSLFYLQHLDGLNQQDTFITLVGEQRTLHLSDGSTLQLNTNSRVEVDFSRDERSIRLSRGEAHFDVAKNKQRPFYVYAGGSIVQAVGTAFTVRLWLNNEVEVTVEKGRVALTSFDPIEPIEPKTANIAQRQSLVELTAGQSAVFGRRIEQIAQMQPSELNRKLAWRQGMLAYANEPLLDVVDDISRYTDITIEITDPALRKLPVAGYFRVGEVEALLDSLELTFGLNVERISDKHVRLSATLQTK